MLLTQLIVAEVVHLTFLLLLLTSAQQLFGLFLRHGDVSLSFRHLRCSLVKKQTNMSAPEKLKKTSSQLTGVHVETG